MLLNSHIPPTTPRQYARRPASMSSNAERSREEIKTQETDLCTSFLSTRHLIRLSLFTLFCWQKMKNIFKLAFFTSPSAILARRVFGCSQPFPFSLTLDLINLSPPSLIFMYTLESISRLSGPSRQFIVSERLPEFSENKIFFHLVSLVSSWSLARGLFPWIHKSGPT